LFLVVADPNAPFRNEGQQVSKRANRRHPDVDQQKSILNIPLGISAAHSNN
jgi:hypothetical protein